MHSGVARCDGFEEWKRGHALVIHSETILKNADVKLQIKYTRKLEGLKKILLWKRSK